MMNNPLASLATASGQQPQDSLAQVLAQVHDTLNDCEKALLNIEDRIEPTPRPEAQTKASEPGGIYELALCLRNQGNRIRNGLARLSEKLGGDEGQEAGPFSRSRNR